MSSFPSDLIIFSTTEQLADNLASKILFMADKLISEKGLFVIALSGGSMVSILKRLFENEITNWEAWRIFFADERCVSHEDSESTYGTFLREIFSKTTLPLENVINISDTLDPESAASDYERKFKEVVPDLSVDLILLGMGPDGHTASLFPRHPIVEYSGPAAIIPIFDSPKPPPQRITMTLSTINAAKEVIFAVTGTSKSDIIAEILSTELNVANERLYFVRPTVDFPCSLINPQKRLTWMLDTTAASRLSSEFLSRL